MTRKTRYGILFRMRNNSAGNDAGGLSIGRRRFIGRTTAAGLAAALGDWWRAFAAGAGDDCVGRPWKGWTRGEFQAHIIYTGRA